MTQNASKTSDTWHLATLESPVDGVSIRYGWQELESAEFGILILNGRMEWIEKYTPLPGELPLSRSVCWATLDHRGQGGSGGPKAHVRTYEDYARDAAAVARKVFGTRPYAIIAHSMGGLIGVYGSLHGHLQPRMMALCAPLFALPERPIPRRWAEPLAAFMRRTPWRVQPTGVKKERRTSFHQNPLTHCIDGFQTNLHAPYLYASPSFGWVAATFDACRDIFRAERLQSLPCPVQIFSGSQESIVDPRVYPSWCQQAALVQPHAIDYRRIQDGRHELLNEIPRIKSEVLASMSGWLERYLLDPRHETDRIPT